MINWEEFEHIHVIKKLKQVLSSWWNIDVVFTDERGHLKGFDTEKMAFNNPAIGYLVNKEVSQANLAEMVVKTIDDLRSSQNRYTLKKWDLGGFDVGIFPIMIENDFVGTVVALGEIHQLPAFRRHRDAADDDVEPSVHDAGDQLVENGQFPGAAQGGAGADIVHHIAVMAGDGAIVGKVKIGGERCLGADHDRFGRGQNQPSHHRNYGTDAPHQAEVADRNPRRRSLFGLVKRSAGGPCSSIRP